MSGADIEQSIWRIRRDCGETPTMVRGIVTAKAVNHLTNLAFFFCIQIPVNGTFSCSLVGNSCITCRKVGGVGFLVCLYLFEKE